MSVVFKIVPIMLTVRAGTEAECDSQIAEFFDKHGPDYENFDVPQTYVTTGLTDLSDA